MPHQTQNGKSIVYEQPKLSKPLPYKKSEKFKSMGFYAETDDVRGGMGLEGAAEFQKFVEAGGVLLTFGVASYFPAEFGLAPGVNAQAPAQGFYAPGPYVQSEILLPAHPVMWGYAQKTLPVRYAGGPLLQAGAPAEFAAFVGSSPERPQVIARFTGGEAGVLSGLMRNPDQVRNRPMVVDAPVGQGPRDPLRQQPHLPVADLRRAPDGVQRAAVLERPAGQRGRRQAGADGGAIGVSPGLQPRRSDTWRAGTSVPASACQMGEKYP